MHDDTDGGEVFFHLKLNRVNDFDKSNEVNDDIDKSVYMNSWIVQHQHKLLDPRFIITEVFIKLH